MLAVRRLCTSKCACQVGRGCKCRLGGVDPPRQSRCDLLRQPTIAVRVAESHKGTVAGVVGRGPAYATAFVVELKLGARGLGVEHLANLDAESDELIVRGRDIGNDQIQAFG